MSESSCGNCTEDDEEMAAPPEYRHAFSNAMAKALDAAAAAKKPAGAYFLTFLILWLLVGIKHNCLFHIQSCRILCCCLHLVILLYCFL